MASKQINDKEIIEKIQKGEIEAFTLIYQKYKTRIKNFLSKALFDKIESDDLMQNVFFKFYKALEKNFNNKQPILPYLYSISRNELKMYYRSHKPVKILSSIDLDKIKGKDYVNNATPEDIDGWRKLKQNQQTSLKMLNEGYSYYDIAEKLSHPINKIKTIVSRARKILFNSKTKTNG